MSATNGHVQENLQTVLNNIESRIERGLYDASVGFKEIRDRKLYMLVAPTFEEYGRVRWKKSRAWLYQQIEIEDVREELPPEMSTAVDTVSKARELRKVPKKRRMHLITDIQKQEKDITPQTIKEAARAAARPAIPMPPEPIDVKEVVYDATGYEIPDHKVEFYNQGREIGKDLLTRVSGLRGALRRGENEKDPRFAFVSISTTVSLLNNLYSEISQLAPYAVCPYCQGQVSDHCMTCRKTGFLPKHIWDRAVPEELKAVREKAVKKKG
jgi:hypothetical protein